MKKLIITLVGIMLCSLQMFAQHDTILAPGTHFTFPVLPDASSYYIGVKNGIPANNEIWLKLPDYQSGTVGWTFPGGSNDFSDSTHTHLPGHHNVAFKKNNNVTTYLDIYIRYFVDIIDSTIGSATYGLMPDTVWINPGDSAILSVGTGFKWYWWGIVGQSGYLWDNQLLNSITVPAGVYKIQGKDNDDYFSYDTIVVASICTTTSSSQTFTECSGFSVTVGSHTYNTTGTYVDTLQNAGGCDSIVTTNLTINQSSSSLQTFTECAGFTVTVGTHTYNATGVYTDVLIAANGCDSIVTTDLTINQSFSSHSYTECLGFTVTVDGHTYDATGTYVDTLIAASGCDSIVITNLTINQPSASSQTLLECEGFTVSVGSHTYDATGIYIDTLMAANGCDSIVTTDLTINEGPSLDLGADTVVINLGSTATLTANVSNVETYLWSTGDTTSSIVVDSMGWYYLTVTNACGSEIDSVYLDVITSARDPRLSTLKTVKVCPNPATDFIKISGYNLEIKRIEIYSQDGRMLMQILDKNTSKSIDISMLKSGVYVIRINGESPTRFVKN
ncbi:MAG: T9SS type A sorting domain-containing protein [Bacteroidetes bacterium]|nr:T9SS type A sorting domain-containing protein [Bacteroidota bacterium]